MNGHRANTETPQPNSPYDESMNELREQQEGRELKRETDKIRPNAEEWLNGEKDRKAA
jgi:hypothetical protein